MRLLRWITYSLFVVMLALFIGFNIYNNVVTDETRPIIRVPSGSLEISISASSEELLAGVTAYDEKDGDLTDSILIESISSFIAENTCEITYAVADNDRHVSKATREIVYTDYVPPRFSLSRPLIFSLGERVDFRRIVGAVDCIGGDIGSSVSFVASDYLSSVVGVYTLSVRVTGLRGDTIYYDFPVWVEQQVPFAPVISLTDNLVYVKQGEKPDLNSFVAGVYQQNEPLADCTPVIVSDLDTDTPGLYAVHYYATAEDGLVGHTILIVIVEEN